MYVSLHALLALIFGGILLSAVVGPPALSRRVRHPQRVRVALTVLAVVGVPVNLAGTGLAVGSAASLAVLYVSLAALAAAGAMVALLRIDRQPTRLPRRVLAIGAHPDDLEIACGGTLAKFVDSGHEVHVLVMSDGSKGGDRSTRVGEAHRGASFLGAASVTVHQLPDTRLSESGQQMVGAIEALIRRHNPDIVLTHSGNDQHQDHHAVHEATLRAARQHSTILCYESPSVTRAFDPSVFVDIEDYVDVKVEAVGIHENQAGKPYMTPQRLRGLATFRGAQAKRQYAEGFEAVRVLGSAVGDL
ncbi:PIG-L deacetylase family protein [Occultella kanbiaonis]|uniref:PIG-L deacetylase family protein n=1 Tax=Occultella kanbiaonis TaxID=2675754 RepID=UPI0013D5B6E0|nr:PIG-L deacetylase family protein [Occultella kanbiaonis]